MLQINKIALIKKIKGVYWDNAKQRWTAHLTHNDKRYSKVFLNYNNQLNMKIFKHISNFFTYQEPPPEYIEELRQLSDNVLELN